MDYPVISIGISDPRYPSQLKDIPNAPHMLWCRGNLKLLDGHNTGVAVVGTRDPSAYAVRVARYVASTLAGMGCMVVSGLANGIDAAAHTAVVEDGGLTVAVLTHITHIYPRENEGLAQRILDTDGLLVAEHPPAHRIEKRDFFLRDRIQSGLSRVVIPIQCGLTSGTMHTVRAAQEQGRQVFCPGISPRDYVENKERYAGVYDLLMTGKATRFDPQRAESLLDALDSVLKASRR